MSDFQLKDEALQKEKEDYVRAIFNKMDADGSGTLTLPELQPFFDTFAEQGRSKGMAHRVHPHEAEHVFEMMDANKDGVIDRTEVLTLFNKFGQKFGNAEGTGMQESATMSDQGDADSGNHKRTKRTKKGSKKRSRRGHQASANTNGGDHNEL